MSPYAKAGAIQWKDGSPRTTAAWSLRRLSFSAPAYFYPLLFLVTYQIADLFDSFRDLLGGVAKAAFFPVLNLTAAGGFESAELGDLFKWTARAWTCRTWTRCASVCLAWCRRRCSPCMPRCGRAHLHQTENSRRLASVLLLLLNVGKNVSWHAAHAAEADQMRPGQTSAVFGASGN